MTKIVATWEVDDATAEMVVAVLEDLVRAVRAGMVRVTPVQGSAGTMTNREIYERLLEEMHHSLSNRSTFTSRLKLQDVLSALRDRVAADERISEQQAQDSAEANVGRRLRPVTPQDGVCGSTFGVGGVSGTGVDGNGGSKRMTREQWDEAICHNESEEYLVAGIRRHLLTQEQRQEMFNRDITIEDVLNGRTEQEHEQFVNNLFEQWNAKLGFEEFGF